MATLHFDDHPLVTWRLTSVRNGRTTVEPAPESKFQGEDLDLMPPPDSTKRAEFPARGLVDDIDTLSVEPARAPGVSGLAALGASLDARSWQTHRFIMTGGHSVSGVVYNSSVTSKRVIRIDIDTNARTATYEETNDFDDI